MEAQKSSAEHYVAVPVLKGEDEGLRRSHSGGTDPGGARLVSRSPRAWKLFVYALIEASWLAFCGAVKYRTILLARWDQAILKGIVTSLGVLWQLLALWPIQEVVNEAFSAEWSFVFRRRGTLVGAKVDRVSTMTSGQWDRLLHAFSPKAKNFASSTFKVALVISWIAMLLSAIAPGAISIYTVQVPSNSTISIGSIRDGSNSRGINVEGRAAAIARIETVEGSLFGYHMSPGMTFGWTNTIKGNESLSAFYEYESDIVNFNYTCQWLAPSLRVLNSTESSPSVVETGIWEIGGVIGRVSTIGAAVTYNGHDREGIFWLDLLTRNGTTGWLILGSDNVNSTIDLSSTPNTVRNSTGWQIGRTPDPQGQDPPLAVALVCDPHVSISSGTITMSRNELKVTRVSNNTVGNVDEPSAATMLMGALAYATSPEEQGFNGTHLNILAAQLILEQQYHSPESPSFQPQPLANITSFMDDYITSAVKAYTDGFLGTQQTTARIYGPRLALQISAPQFIVTACLSGLVFILGFIQVFMDVGEPLSIRAVANALTWNSPLGLEARNP
ncbi:hypothetical protein IE53DRAFT_371158 [Violaceomyces palustris]|uniref:Uncharacterized protein n=1 Tax=Violaceomyces palustris TaxID=1673888 RepID=A0ACD0NPL7_9BASI|nr:hypothetical protein IE53DRAFT_371158 [Violaceomyces palustris]